MRQRSAVSAKLASARPLAPLAQTAVRAQASLGNQAVLRLLQHARDGAGRPLDPASRARFEPRFGHDFRGVRIHDGGAAAAAARAIDAQAYTVGRDVVVGDGFDPQSPSGQAVLAHELAHVVQQGASTRGSRLALSGPGDRWEQEADRAAELALHGGAPIRLSPAPDGVIARKKVTSFLAAEVAKLSAAKATDEAAKQALGKGLGIDRRVLERVLRADYDAYLLDELESLRAQIAELKTSHSPAAVQEFVDDLADLDDLCDRLIAFLFRGYTPSGNDTYDTIFAALETLRLYQSMQPGGGAEVVPRFNELDAAGKPIAKAPPPTPAGAAPTPPVNALVTGMAEDTFNFMRAVEALPDIGIARAIANQQGYLGKQRQYGKLSSPALAAELRAGERPNPPITTLANLDSLTWEDLVRIWAFELGGAGLQQLVFGAGARLTGEVRRLRGVTEIVEQAKRDFRDGQWPHDSHGYALRKWQVHYNAREFFNSVTIRNTPFNFLGSYRVEITVDGDDPRAALHVVVVNTASLTSFSRFRAPDPIAPEGARPILKDRKTRDEPGVRLGANLVTQFEWLDEQRLANPFARNSLFDFDKFTLRDDSATTGALDDIAARIKANPEIKLVYIDGHTDERGDAKHNQRLSQQRADAVMQGLVHRGVAKDRLTARGLGATRPLYPGARTEREHQANRRVELHVEQ